MAKSTMASSTPRLSEYARSFVFPAGIKRTVWPRVEAKGRDLGLGFDWWQSQLGTVVLGYGDDGKYVATVGGIGMSIPRQVGKTYFVLALLVIMCILFPGLQVVWTAHHLRTSTKTFTSLRGICRRKKVAPHVRAMRAANGEQQVEFVNGSMIYFGARSQGFGRGFDEIDVEVFDEAQILDTKALEDMIAATNQARHEHGALLFFMGTPPRPTDPSESFTERRKEARDGTSEDAIWLEIGADPQSDPDDRAQWPLMNPSFPKRTPVESILRLKKNLKSEDSWNREGRGIWDEQAAGEVGIPFEPWQDLALETVPTDWPLASLGLDMHPVTGRLYVGVGAFAPEPSVHVELVAEDILAGGVDGAVDWIVKRVGRRLPVVIPADSPATMLHAALVKARCKVYVLNLTEQWQASAAFERAVSTDATLWHFADPLLDQAVKESTREQHRNPGQWRLGRSGELQGAPLWAVAAAHFGAVKWSKRRGAASSSESARSGRASSGRASTSRGVRA